MVGTKFIAAALCASMMAPPAPEPEAAAPEPASEVESVFDMGLDEPPPPPPEPRTDTEGPQSVFDMGLDEPPPPPPSAARPETNEAPPELPPSTLRQAGWGTLIGGFAVASFAGVALGFAERERNRTRRISLAYDLYGTSPRALPEDIADTLEASKRNRVRFTVISASLAATTAVTLIVSGVMLGVARKRRKQKARLQAGIGTLRF